MFFHLIIYIILLGVRSDRFRNIVCIFCMDYTDNTSKDNIKRDSSYPLKEEEEIALFEAKCEDLSRTITDVQEERFLHTLRTRCNKRIFDLSESGIGPVAMMVLEEVLLKYPQYSVLKLCLLFILMMNNNFM